MCSLVDIMPTYMDASVHKDRQWYSHVLPLFLLSSVGICIRFPLLSSFSFTSITSPSANPSFVLFSDLILFDCFQAVLGHYALRLSVDACIWELHTRRRLYDYTYLYTIVFYCKMIIVALNSHIYMYKMATEKETDVLLDVM